MSAPFTDDPKPRTRGKWDDYLAYEKSGELSEEQLAGQTRQKVL